MKTKVIFRTWHSNGVFALFPQLPHDSRGNLCVSYEHQGQHAGASPELNPDHSRKATPMEYAPLKAELERQGYDLAIGLRITAKDHRERVQSAMRRRT